MYDFQEQLHKQEEYSRAFITWLKNRDNVDHIVHPTEDEDRAGIDLWAFTPSKKSIQIKTDFWVDRTGNMAYEMISVAHSEESTAEIGWGLHICDIDYLIYIAAESGNIYCFCGDRLQAHVLERYKDFKNFSANNDNYYTFGVLVPLSILDDIMIFKDNLFDHNANIQETENAQICHSNHSR